MNNKRIALVCALAAIAIGGGAGLVSVAFNGWNATALVHVAVTDPLSEVARHNSSHFVLVDPEAHYDGAYFYAIALDPVGRGTVHQLIDHYPYRWGHAGYGWLSRLVSLPFGPYEIPKAMFLIGVASVGLAAYGMSKIATLLGRSSWWGLIGALVPGIVVSVSIDTSEPLGVALGVLGVLAWMRKRRWQSMLWFALACLVKEMFVFIPVGIGLWEITQMIRERSASRWFARVGPLALSLAPLAAWYIYLRITFGQFPFEDGPAFYSAPFAGWFDSLKIAAHDAVHDRATQIAIIAIPILLIVAALVLVGFFSSLRARTPFQMIFLLPTLFAIFFSWRLLLYPKDLFREVILQSVLLPAVFIKRWEIPRNEPFEAAQEPEPARAR